MWICETGLMFLMKNIFIFVKKELEMLVGTDRGNVQLGPSDVHSCLSCSFRLSCSRETAVVVRAGLETEAPRAGPPVVFTICDQITQNQC